MTRLEQIRYAPDVKAAGINAVTTGAVTVVLANSGKGRMAGAVIALAGVAIYVLGKRWE